MSIRKNRIYLYFRRKLVAGVLTLVPMAIAVWFVWILFDFSDNVIGKYIYNNQWLKHHGVVRVPGTGLLIMLLIILAAGFFSTSVIGKRVIAWFDRLIADLPFAKSIYLGVKQIMETFSAGGASSFERVVMIPFPHKDMYVIGFATGELNMRNIHGPDKGLVTVFVPTTPNPTSGYLVMTPYEDVYFLDMTIEEGIKIIVSGGMVVPEGSVIKADLDASLIQENPNEPG